MLRNIQKISSRVKLNKGGSLFLNKPYFSFSENKNDTENKDDKGSENKMGKREEEKGRRVKY